MDVVRRFVFGWGWRAAACVAVVGYGLAAVVAVSLLGSQVGQRSSRPVRVVVALGLCVSAVVAHRWVRGRMCRWKPATSVLRLIAEAIAIVVIVPLAIVFWPLTLVVLASRSSAHLPPAERRLRLAGAYLLLSGPRR